MEPLSDVETRAVLRDAGFGVLALVDGDEPYAVPMSVGYDGTTAYMQWTDAGHKVDVVARNPAGMLVVTEFTETRTRSVCASGPVERVPDDEAAAAFEALADNAEFGVDLSIRGDPMRADGLALYALRVEMATGLSFGPG